jgi:secreted PhoX family phosphatase
MSVDDKISNKSGNRPFADVLEVNLSRRKVLVGGLATAAGTFIGSQTVGAAPGLNSKILRGEKNGTPLGKFGKDENLIGFSPLTNAQAMLQSPFGKVPAISEDYEFQYLIPWGQSLYSNVPSYTGGMTRPTPEQQAKQIGIGHDGMWFFPSKSGNPNEHGYLAINHEFGRNTHILGKPAPASADDVLLSQHGHGVSVVEIAKVGNMWELVQDNMTQARRIHVNTPVTFSGPVAGHPLLQTPMGNAPAGTVNNCANGYTPWGTYLTCEENFNGYFGSTAVENMRSAKEQFVTDNELAMIEADVDQDIADGEVDPGDRQDEIDDRFADRVDELLDQEFELTASDEQLRYGFDYNGFNYGWENFDDRFDLSNPLYKNEENRFGWIVEIDPYDNTQTPVKRTALGRVKHEGIALTVGKGGRVVGYMGDDQANDYIYKFVSSGNWKSMKARGVSPLDEGKLYVARFNEDGTGDWLELTIENPALAERFNSQAEVLVYARVAADILGATPMDRPEWTTVAPDGQVYCTLTNNGGRTVADAANPQAPNTDGHIIRWTDSGTTFEWDIFLLASLLASDQAGTEWTFTDPDGLWADPNGRLFIQTDGGQPDVMIGGMEFELQDQMVVADTTTGEIKRLFMGVEDDEITGVAVTPDRKTMFVNIQHPGNGNPADTNIPAPTDGFTIPRDVTVVITKKDGGIIGS